MPPERTGAARPTSWRSTPAALRIAGLLADRLTALGAREDEAARLILWRVRFTWVRAVTLRKRVAPVLATLDDCGIRALLMKGPAILHHVGGPTAWRPMEDLDLLVAPADGGPAAAVLEEHGFASAFGATARRPAAARPPPAARASRRSPRTCSRSSTPTTAGCPASWPPSRPRWPPTRRSTPWSAAELAGRLALPPNQEAAHLFGTVLIRREAWDAVTRSGADLDDTLGFFTAARRTLRIGNVAGVVLERRVHGANWTLRERERLHADYLRAARAAILAGRDA